MWHGKMPEDHVFCCAHFSSRISFSRLMSQIAIGPYAYYRNPINSCAACLQPASYVSNSPTALMEELVWWCWGCGRFLVLAQDRAMLDTEYSDDSSAFCCLSILILHSQGFQELVPLTCSCGTLVGVKVVRLIEQRERRLIL